MNFPVCRMGSSGAATAAGGDLCLHCSHCRERLLQQQQHLQQQQQRPEATKSPPNSPKKEVESS